MSKRKGPDVKALRAAVRALNQCSSPNMVRATLEFLWDRYLTHPSAELPEHLRPEAGSRPPETTGPQR